MALIIDKKRSIGEAARELGIPEHVIRFWGAQFRDYIKPSLGAGKRRYFYDKDMKVLQTIKYYLYDRGYTIKGLNKLLEEENLQVIDRADSSSGGNNPNSNPDENKNINVAGTVEWGGYGRIQQQNQQPTRQNNPQIEFNNYPNSYRNYGRDYDKNIKDIVNEANRSRNYQNFLPTRTAPVNGTLDMSGYYKNQPSLGPEQRAKLLSILGEFRGKLSGFYDRLKNI